MIEGDFVILRKFGGDLKKIIAYNLAIPCWLSQILPNTWKLKFIQTKFYNNIMLMIFPLN